MLPLWYAMLLTNLNQLIMKFKLLLILILTFTLQLQAQTFSKSIKNDIVKNQTIKTDVNGTIKDYRLTKGYFIKANKEPDSDYLIIELLSDVPDSTESFKIYPLTIEVFSERFRQAFSNLVKKVEGKEVHTETVFSELEISLLFVQLIAFERTENEQPIVARITLKKEIPVRTLYGAKDQYSAYAKEQMKKVKSKDDNPSDEEKKENAKIKKDLNKKRDSLYTIEPLKDTKLELTFFNGYIEKVELETKVLNTKVRFTNTYSIGISSSNGIKNFTKNNILSFYKYRIENNKLVRDDSGYFLEINFADVIDYDREIDINANDISPEPTKLVLDNIKDQTNLYKEESTKLFEAVVYSDFLGVFDAENPNGVIQTEVAKKFYINTHRYEITPKGRWLGLLFPPIAFSEGYGWFEYIDVSAKLSKIEENNKFLNPSIVNDTSYFSPLRIMQHQSFSIGADINLLYLENQNKKVNTNLDFGLRYGRSGLQLDENTQEFFNSITTSAELGFQFIPEKRYGFLASAKVLYFQVYNDDGFNVKSLKDGALTKPNQWFNKTQFEFFVNTSSTGKLFMRYNLVTELDDWDNNFSQFQFGYSFYLLKQNGKIK